MVGGHQPFTFGLRPTGGKFERPRVDKYRINIRTQAEAQENIPEPYERRRRLRDVESETDPQHCPEASNHLLVGT